MCQSELRRIENELIRSGDGASIADLETEASCADKDAIDVRIDQIGTELSEVEQNLSEARDARAKALFMTVWCPDSRSVESNCGIPRG